MTCESVGIRWTAVERLVVGGVVGAVVGAGGGGGRVVVGGELVDGGVLGGAAVVSVVVGSVVGVVVEGDVEVGAATDEVVGFDEEGLESPIDVSALSLSVLQAISATASVATANRRATAPEDRAVALTTEP